MTFLFQIKLEHIIELFSFSDFASVLLTKHFRSISSL